MVVAADHGDILDDRDAMLRLQVREDGVEWDQ
jgi:hypothetical protein